MIRLSEGSRQSSAGDASGGGAPEEVSLVHDLDVH